MRWLIYTPCFIKRTTLFSIQLSHFMVDFYKFCTTGNRNEYSTRQAYKQCHFNFTVFPHYLVKLKIAKNADRLLQCVLLNRLFQTFAESRSIFVSFPVCLKKKIISLLTENVLHSQGFFEKLSSNSIWLILACELKLNCHDSRRITVMTSSSNQVSRLHVLVEYSFLFPVVQEL